MTREILAVVPARSGSEGLPGKNLFEVGGTSLVARAVAAARSSRLVTRVIGSTDDATTAAALAAAGAEVPWLRPSQLATPSTPDTPVFLHVLEMLAAEGYEPEIVVNVRPTAPLRTGADIDAAVQLLIDHPKAVSVKSVALASQHPYKMWSLSDEGVLVPLLPDWHERLGGDPDVPRQNLPLVYKSDGAVDAVRVKSLIETGMFHPGPVLAYVMDSSRSLDVDDEEDLVVATYRLGKSQ